MACSKPVDYSKTIDINNKESVKKVEFIYDDPDVQLKKIIEIIKVRIIFNFFFKILKNFQKLSIFTLILIFNFLVSKTT